MTTINFVDELPAAARTTTSTKGGLTPYLEAVHQALKSRPNQWGLVGQKVRSPEIYFTLRNHEVELAIRDAGTMPSMRDPKVTVKARAVYARFVQGYVYVPKTTK
jgi:hypothetical protein